jgi:hypothetical protein
MARGSAVLEQGVAARSCAQQVVVGDLGVQASGASGAVDAAPVGARSGALERRVVIGEPSQRELDHIAQKIVLR